ncbi:hypothetical protein JYT15_00765 [Acidimicrobium ferrooxidans]|nr:hypothetical protein [Acidimicrobium ferrooxidans]
MSGRSFPIVQASLSTGLHQLEAKSTHAKRLPETQTDCARRHVHPASAAQPGRQGESAEFGKIRTDGQR